MPNEKNVETKTTTLKANAPAIPKLKIDIGKVVSTVRTHFGKDKSSAAQVSTGSSISLSTEDKDYIVWRNSDGSKSCWELLTGIRGIPYGKVVSVSGPSNSGKSSHGMKFAALAQAQNCIVILVDTENKFAKERFNVFFGGDSDQLLVTTSKMILEGANHVEQMVHAIYSQNANQKILIVIDSIGGSLSKSEGEDSLDQTKQMAQSAKEYGSTLRAYTRLMEKYKNRETNEEQIAVFMVVQTYSSIGGYGGQKESGGQRIEYYSSLLIQLNRFSDLTKVKDGQKYKYGILTKAKVKKNHLNTSESTLADLQLMITAGGIELAKKNKNEDGSDLHEEIDE